MGCLLLGACASSNVYISKNFAIQKIAVLPMANNTNDLDGPAVVRDLLFIKMAERGYQLVSRSDVDAQLKEQGFTDGGQLRAATPQQLGQWTGSDTLFYSTLEDFNYLNVGFYWQRKVRLSGKLVDAKTGERLWEAERSFSTQAVVADKERAKRQFAAQMAVKWLEKASHRPLQAESRIAVERLLHTLPYQH